MQHQTTPLNHWAINACRVCFPAPRLRQRWFRGVGEGAALPLEGPLGAEKLKAALEGEAGELMQPRRVVVEPANEIGGSSDIGAPAPETDGAHIGVDQTRSLDGSWQEQEQEQGETKDRGSTHAAESTRVWGGRGQAGCAQSQTEDPTG